MELSFDPLLDMYVKDIESGICAKDGEPKVEKESAASALVNGNNLLGPVVGNFCMDLAIKKAKEAGVGWVVAHGGFVAPKAKTQQTVSPYPDFSCFRLQPLWNRWTLRNASSEGKHDRKSAAVFLFRFVKYVLRNESVSDPDPLQGMSFTNTSPLVVPTRGKQVHLDVLQRSPASGLISVLFEYSERSLFSALWAPTPSAWRLQAQAATASFWTWPRRRSPSER